MNAYVYLFMHAIHIHTHVHHYVHTYKNAYILHVRMRRLAGSILLYTTIQRPNTTIFVSSYYYLSAYYYVCPRTTMYVSSYYYMSPHTTMYASPYYYMCPHTIANSQVRRKINDMIIDAKRTLIIDIRCVCVCACACACVCVCVYVCVYVCVCVCVNHRYIIYIQYDIIYMCIS